MRAEGLDVCSLSAGEPDFDTPIHIKAAAIQALEAGKTRYGPAAGLPQLRLAVAEKLQREQQISVSRDQVMISNGGKQTLFNLAMVLLEAGDEVIIPAPYWVSYPEMVKLTNATPVFVTTNEASGFKLSPVQLEAAITPRTKLLVLNSPGNPTGTVYSREDLLSLVEILRQHPQVYVISDEIYEKLIYSSEGHTSIASLAPDLSERIVISSGFSKAYAMTGWRIGYLIGPLEIIQAAISLQSHSTSNVCTFAQYGALAALTDPASEQHVQIMRQQMAERRTQVLKQLQSMPGIHCVEPEGAFYLFPNIAASGLDSLSFCQQLLQDYHVAVVPGQAFGSPAHIRLSYAADQATLEKGMTRLQQFLASL
jgi:aspartate aminotransferase